MKQLIFIVIFYTNVSFCFAQEDTQKAFLDQSNSNAFKVIDMKINSSNYLIVTSRDDFGRTFQFYTGKSDPITLGLTTFPDFVRGTVSPENNKKSNYVILKPFYLNQCCSISKIESRMNDKPVDFIIAKEDTAYGLTYFTRNSSPAVPLKIKQPVYQKIFNNKRYAILKPPDERDINKNIFYSYEFKFMTHELYNGLRKNTTEQNIISTIKDPVSGSPLPDTGKIEVSSMPGGNFTTGMIHVDVAADVECTIHIYSRYNNRLYSSGRQRKFLLFPEIYTIEISGMVLKNIPVQKGVDTRVKTGTLRITADTTWTLYDENKLKKIYTSSAPGKVEFPIGIYQLEINGSVSQVEIKDGETLAFNSATSEAVVLQNPDTASKSVINSKPVSHLIIPKENTDTIIPPANKNLISSLPSINSGHIEMSEIMFGKNMTTGMLHIDVPADAECAINIYSVPDHTLLYNSVQQRSFSLLPGTYDIEISGMGVKNIPVNKAMDTRIKAGVLSITSNGPWTIFDKDKIKAIYSSAQPKKLGLPTGFYQLEINGALNLVEIKDHDILNYDTSRKAVILIQKQDVGDSTKNIIVTPVIPNSLAGDKKWEVKQNLTVRGNNGRIVLAIPKEIESIITITQPVTEKEVYYSGILTKERSFSLPPGNYDVKVSGHLVKNVPVQKGMDTRIKAGVLEVTVPGIWTLFDEKKDKQVYFSTSEKKIGLPAGIYQLEINGTLNQVNIKDGETVKF